MEPERSRHGRVRVFIACSLDGFIAGPEDDLSWLPAPGDGTQDGGFGEFLSGIGAVIMGRRTYDVVASFDGAWPYGERPILVATTRTLEARQPSVRAVSGDVEAIVSEALRLADGKGVYVDGGALIRAVLEAELLEEIVVTVVPTILGAGIPLFAGAARRHRLELVSCERVLEGCVQMTYRLLKRTKVNG